MQANASGLHFYRSWFRNVLVQPFRRRKIICFADEKEKILHGLRKCNNREILGRLLPTKKKNSGNFCVINFPARLPKRKRKWSGLNCMFEFWSPNKFHARLLVSSCLSSLELALNLSELNKSSQLTCTKNPDWCVPFWQFHFIWKKKKIQILVKIWQVNFYSWFLPGLFYFVSRPKRHFCFGDISRCVPSLFTNYKFLGPVVRKQIDLIQAGLA